MAYWILNGNHHPRFISQNRYMNKGVWIILKTKCIMAMVGEEGSLFRCFLYLHACYDILKQRAAKSTRVLAATLYYRIAFCIYVSNINLI